MHPFEPLTMKASLSKPALRKQLFMLILSLVFCGTVSASEQQSALTPKAIFILIDGIPADVIESVATPALDSISAAGGYTRAYVGGEIGTPTESPTISAVGYQSMLTGTWANKHNVYDNKVDNPTINIGISSASSRPMMRGSVPPLSRPGWTIEPS